jgi:hypothetical protein
MQSSKITKPPVFKDDVPDYMLQRAALFLDRFQANKKQRRGELVSIYERLGSPPTIITMVCDNSFMPLVRNWLRSCERSGVMVTDRTIAFALDRDAAQCFAELGLPYVLLDPADYPPAGGSQIFGDQEFASAVFYKSALLTDLLELGAKVLFQDVDLIWFEDPIPALDENADLQDIQLMYDGPNPQYAPFNANTGFFYVTPTPVSKALFNAAMLDANSLFWLRNDQVVLNKLFEWFVEEDGLRLAILAEKRFLNGHLFPLEGDVSPAAGDWKNDGVVFHYSWTENIAQKYQKLDRYGFNYES